MHHIVLPRPGDEAEPISGDFAVEQLQADARGFQLLGIDSLLTRVRGHDGRQLCRASY